MRFGCRRYNKTQCSLFHQEARSSRSSSPPFITHRVYGVALLPSNRMWKSGKEECKGCWGDQWAVLCICEEISVTRTCRTHLASSRLVSSHGPRRRKWEEVMRSSSWAVCRPGCGACYHLVAADTDLWSSSEEAESLHPLTSVSIHEYANVQMCPKSIIINCIQWAT